MRYNFEIFEVKSDSRQSPTPKEEVQWLPLRHHPVFASTSGANADDEEIGDGVPLPSNLTAWDGDTRLYYWHNRQHCLHRISLRLGDPDPTSILAATPSKVMKPDVKPGFAVNKISINRNGSALLLAGSDGLAVIYLYGRASAKEDAIVCRTVSIGQHFYFGSSNVIHLLQASWHPNSETHVGVLSSDSVFRMFDLSSDLVQPEQEYYLQPLEPGRSINASSMCPVDFAFGGDHLWDRFTVFFLFSDGSVYILCPVVPFGSVHKWDAVMEVYGDASTFGLKSSNSIAVSNSNIAISWLETTFSELNEQDINSENISVVKAHPYALLNASLILQGPLRRVSSADEDESVTVRGAECEGRAVCLLYNVVSKDSILATAWSGGQVQIDALADEIQPVWIYGTPPRLRMDSHDKIHGLAMICESNSVERPIVKLDQPLDHTAWLGHPPPLIRLAIVDLALSKRPLSSSLITLFADPLMPERIYTLHDDGIDSIVLHFLPFTSQALGKGESIKTPSVHPVLSTCQEESSLSAPLLGFVSLSDSFGYSWIVALTSATECIVLEMKTWDLLLPVHVDISKQPSSSEEPEERDSACIISEDLLGGPRVVLAPQALPTPRSTPADSIEGRSILHQYFKLFHENYVEYAHKVYFELKHHAPHLKRLINDQEERLSGAREKMLAVEKKQPLFEERIDHAVQVHNSLELRLQKLRRLPGVHKKPLSRAEREFKSQLDRFNGVELDALRSSVETLKARLKRNARSPKATIGSQKRQLSRKNYSQDSQISQLQSSIAKLSLLNSENSKKVKVLESALKSQENSLR